MNFIEENLNSSNDLINLAYMFDFKNKNNESISSVTILTFNTIEDKLEISNNLMDKSNKSLKLIFKNKIVFKNFSIKYGNDFINQFKNFLMRYSEDTDSYYCSLPQQEFRFRDFKFVNLYQDGFVFSKNDEEIVVNIFSENIEEYEYETKLDELVKC